MMVMTEHDRPTGNLSATGRSRRRRRWLAGLTAVVAAGATTVATAAAYVVTHDGNDPLAAGVHRVEVYTVLDSISTVVPPADRPDMIGRFIGMCDADTYYVEVAGSGLCVVLNGPLGTVQVTGAAGGARLGADEAATVRDIVRREDSGEPTTRVLLGYDGGWAAMVAVADLNAGGPVTGAPVG